MHVKYAVLHRSYSAPVRVSAMDTGVAAARDVTDVPVPPPEVTRAAVVVRIGIVPAGIGIVIVPFVRDVVAAREPAGMRAVSFAVPDTVARAVVVRDVVAGVVLRTVTPPREDVAASRVTASAIPAQHSIISAKARIFLILKINVSKFVKIRASEICV